MATDVMSMAMPAAIICSAANASGADERLLPLLSIVPIAQPSEPMRRINTPISSTWPSPTIARGPMRMIIPASPRASPMITGRRGRTPRGRSQSNTTIQIGVVDTMRATIPVGTVSSAHMTAPLPTPSISTPVIAADLQSYRSGALAPRQRANAYSSSPAKVNRAAPIMNGGTLSIAYLMNRYVDPQMT